MKLLSSQNITQQLCVYVQIVVLKLLSIGGHFSSDRIPVIHCDFWLEFIGSEWLNMGRGFCLHSIALVIFINLEQHRKRHPCIEYMGSILKPFYEILLNFELKYLHCNCLFL